MAIPALGSPVAPITNRPLSFLAADTAAVQAIAQAAVSVELFTIPLYMNAMYSLYGTHQINSAGNTYYQGRQWPGMSTTASPGTDNQKAFNIIFSVFIQEMLHLQMAANIATAIGVKPQFTEGSGLQNGQGGWTCFGPTLTSIPCIVDLQDTTGYSSVVVNLGALNQNTISLFLAIEEPEAQARAQLQNHADKYFPAVPFANWQAGQSLPLFGSIGWMYECYAQYLSISYADGQTLWQKLFVANSVQQDMFNVQNSGHSQAEYAGFQPFLSAGVTAADAFNQAINMMAAITDQGEGNAVGIKAYLQKAHLLGAVEPDYRESDTALQTDYPSYQGDGSQAPQSADGCARFASAALDHYERFQQVQSLLAGGSIVTWDQWHQQGNTWTAALLTNSAWDPTQAPSNIPKPDEVAAALNRLADAHAELSTVSSGAIYGITSVLNTYWQNQQAAFPYPSMSGSGDRMSICWAVTGKAPDLSQGAPQPVAGKLYHACQGMDLTGTDTSNTCAAVEVFHTCRGSNGCRAQGGCGFAQFDSGGGSCGGSGCGSASLKATHVKAANLCGGPKPPAKDYSAPSDNKCATFGGCAVPISASQLYPSSGTMTLYTFPAPDHHSTPAGASISFNVGDSVYDIAWEAYCKVVGHKVGEQPPASDLRLAMPPST